jgi:glucan 1,3-beta-glucosidase
MRTRTFVFSFVFSVVTGVAAEALHAHGRRQTCSLTPSEPSQFWYEAIDHNGISPFIPDGKSWVVHRNVKTQFGAVGNGVTDDSTPFQNAINAGNSFAARNTNSLGTTGQPAVIYIPSGTYLFKKSIQLVVGTVIMGDPLNPPTIKASVDIINNFLIYGKDPSQIETTNFYIGIKNVILDSTAVNKDQNFALVDWSVSQATQMTNVVFNMPLYSSGHTGISMPEAGSGCEINDCSFYGGAAGVYPLGLESMETGSCTANLRQESISATNNIT